MRDSAAKSSHKGTARAGRWRKPGPIQAAEFKAVCLGLMDQVNETGAEFVITKRGEPVAKLGPANKDLRPFIGRSRGVISAAREEMLSPIAEDWELGADL